MTDVVDQRLKASIEVVRRAVDHIQKIFANSWPSAQKAEYLTFEGLWIARPITRRGERFIEVSHANSELVRAVCDTFPPDKIRRKNGYFYIKV